MSSIINNKIEYKEYYCKSIQLRDNKNFELLCNIEDPSFIHIFIHNNIINNSFLLDKQSSNLIYKHNNLYFDIEKISYFIYHHTTLVNRLKDIITYDEFIEEMEDLTFFRITCLK